MASQKLEALRALQEKEPADLGPAPAPAQAPPKPSPSTPTLQQLVAAFNVDNLSASNKTKLDSLAAECGEAGKVRQLLDSLSIMAAESITAQRQPQVDFHGDEANCQYTGTSEQVSAWEQELAKCEPHGPPTLDQHQQQESGDVGEQSQQQKTSMDAETARTPATKRAAGDAAAEAFARIPEDDLFDAEQEAVQELLGFGDDGKAAGEPQAKAPKTGAASSKTAQESALELAIELQEQLSSNAAEIVVSDVESGAATASGSSVG